MCLIGPPVILPEGEKISSLQPLYPSRPFSSPLTPLVDTFLLRGVNYLKKIPKIPNPVRLFSEYLRLPNKRGGRLIFFEKILTPRSIFAHVFKRGVNYSEKRRTGFGIFLDFLDFFKDISGFFGIFWDFFQESVRDFFQVIYPSVRTSGYGGEKVTLIGTVIQEVISYQTRSYPP